MKFLIEILFITAILIGFTFAQSPIKLTIETRKPGILIPEDFSGLSIETGSLRSGNGGVYGNWFDDSTHFPQPLHAQMITLFKNLGLRNIRVGGGSVDNNNIIPTNSDIDAFFRFVKAAHVSVIYSLRLLYGNITQDTNIAKYVWNNYHQYIQTLSIGNEPDWPSYRDSTKLITGYLSYLAQWKKFAAAVNTAVAAAKFGGPDTGSNYPVPGARNTYYNGLPWTVDFMNDTKNLGYVSAIYLHNYVGQGASGTPQSMADAMLSSEWDNTFYPDLYEASCVPVLKAGLPYRLTESNSFSGSLAGGSTSFATALFALDYLYWWAEHRAAGVNFHNKQWVLNDAIYMDAEYNYQVHPMGYGIAAFNLGGHGKMDSVEISNPDNLNLTAYAVADSIGELFVTIINKEHNTTRPFSIPPRNAEVSISASNFPDTASVMYMTAPAENVLATSGIILGGRTITNNKLFKGLWSPIDTVTQGYYVVNVPAASAAIVKIGGYFISIKSPNLLVYNGDTGVARRTIFKWNSSPKASSYNLQISDDLNFKTIVFDTTLNDTITQLSNPLSSYTKYYWHVRAEDSTFTSSFSAVDSFSTGDNISYVKMQNNFPQKFDLLQNYPNPFNPSTIIEYSIPKSGFVSLNIYNIIGQKVAVLFSGYQKTGKYKISFDASGQTNNIQNLPSGIYFYRLQYNGTSLTKKMILVK